MIVTRPVRVHGREALWRGWCLVIACASLLGRSSAQQYGFAQLTPREGLAQSQVRAIAQDDKGYLWFGTLGGVSRYDGHDFTNYALQEGLPDAQVNALLATRDGRMWLGCGSSLAYYEGHDIIRVPLPSAAQDQRILALAEGVDGSLFIATDGAGVLRSKEGIIAPLVGFPLDTVSSARALLVLPNGDLLIGVRNGTLRWHAGQCQRLQIPSDASVSALALGKDGTIWVGTFGDGLFGLTSGGAVITRDEENGLLQNNIRSLLVDDRGRLWIGTKFGADLLENGRLRVFTVHQGMPSDNVWCMLQDTEGGVWIGTDGAGVLRFAGDRFVTFTVTEGLCSDLVMTMVNDQRGDLWLGTYGNGICRMDGMAMITTLDGLPNNTVWCSLAAADSSLWFGTSDGLCHIRNGKVLPLDADRALTGQRVLSLFRGRDARIWCGTRDGLFILDPDGGVERITQQDHITIKAVRSIRGSGNGVTWLATDQGLVRLEKGQAKRYTVKEGLSDNTVFSLETDARGRLWAGTSNGLSCLDDGHLTVIRLGQDFGSNYVGLLLKDSTGDLWAGTNNGLFHFNADSLLQDPGNAEHVNTEEGLRGSECNLNAAFIDQRARLFFGTNAGLVMHDPGHGIIPGAPAPPTTYITSIRSFLQNTDWKGLSDGIDARTGLPLGLRAVYRKNHLTFDYTAIALSDGDRVRFQYRLTGFDGDWLPATDARFASYSNLPQGDYTFEVRARDRAGHWGPSASFSFVITPPYWLRWWFFTLCALGISAIAVAVVRIRLLRQQRRERTRQLMLRSRMLQLEQQALNANMNRHFIFNALNSIQYYINRQDRAAANKYLTSFAKLIRKNLDASQTDTTSLAEELSRLDLYLLLEHMRFKDKFRYIITIDPAVDTSTVQLPAMMLQPYVENSIWHGILPMDRQGTVAISVSADTHGHIRVDITDDGIGIERSVALKNGAEGDHISRGIEITKGRADILRKLDLADIRITGPDQIGGSGSPLGTRVTILLPYKGSTVKGSDHLLSDARQPTFGNP